MENQRVGSEGEEHLGGQHDAVPFMQAQIERVYLTKGKKEHAEDEPREGRLQRQEEFITQGSDEHAEPEGVGIKEFSHIFFVITL